MDSEAVYYVIMVEGKVVSQRFDNKMVAEMEKQKLPTTTQGPPETFNLAFVQPQQFNVGVSASMLVFDGSYLYAIKGAKLYRELIKKQNKFSPFKKYIYHFNGN